MTRPLQLGQAKRGSCWLCLLPEILFHLFGCSCIFFAFHLYKTAGGVPQASWQDLLPQQCVDQGGLATGGASNEHHLDLLPAQHLPDVEHLPHQLVHLGQDVLAQAWQEGVRASFQMLLCFLYHLCIQNMYIFCFTLLQKDMLERSTVLTQHLDLTSERSLKMVYASFLASSVAASLTPPLIFKRPSLFVDQSDFDDLKTCFGFGSSFPSTQ